MSLKKNILLGRGPGAINAQKTVCGKGHPLEDKNLIVLEDGRRQCRKCRQARNLRRKRSEAGKAYQKRYDKTPQRQRYLQQYRQTNIERNRAYQAQHWQEKKLAITAQRQTRIAGLTPEQKAEQRTRQREYTRRYRAKKASH
jgi:hypothetical protein